MHGLVRQPKYDRLDRLQNTASQAEKTYATTENRQVLMLTLTEVRSWNVVCRGNQSLTLRGSGRTKATGAEFEFVCHAVLG